MSIFKRTPPPRISIEDAKERIHADIDKGGLNPETYPAEDLAAFRTAAHRAVEGEDRQLLVMRNYAFGELRYVVTEMEHVNVNPQKLWSSGYEDHPRCIPPTRAEAEVRRLLKLSSQYADAAVRLNRMMEEDNATEQADSQDRVND